MCCKDVLHFKSSTLRLKIFFFYYLFPLCGKTSKLKYSTSYKTPQKDEQGLMFSVFHQNVLLCFPRPSNTVAVKTSWASTVCTRLWGPPCRYLCAPWAQNVHLCRKWQLVFPCGFSRVKIEITVWKQRQEREKRRDGGETCALTSNWLTTGRMTPGRNRRRTRTQGRGRLRKERERCEKIGRRYWWRDQTCRTFIKTTDTHSCVNNSPSPRHWTHEPDLHSHSYWMSSSYTKLH